jgi:hypothetical protein
MRTDTPAPPDPLETLGLTPAQTSLYNAVLRLHRATCAELAEATNGSPELLGRELAILVRLGVVDEQGGEYLARHPATALGHLVAERLDRLAAESRRIDTVLGSIRGFIHQYDAGRDYQAGQFPVTLVGGADELYESVIGMAIQTPPLELLSAIPDKRTVNDFTHRYADQWIAAQRTNLLSSRFIIPVHTLEISGLRDKLDQFERAGAQVRTLDVVLVPRRGGRRRGHARPVGRHARRERLQLPPRQSGRRGGRAALVLRGTVGPRGTAAVDAPR